MAIIIKGIKVKNRANTNFATDKCLLRVLVAISGNLPERGKERIEIMQNNNQNNNYKNQNNQNNNQNNQNNNNSNNNNNNNQNKQKKSSENYER